VLGVGACWWHKKREAKLKLENPERYRFKDEEKHSLPKEGDISSG
jgi:hypothetical protein